MNVRNVVCLLLLSFLASSCQKGKFSKIPQIELKYFGPEVVKVNKDTCFLQFSLRDGDADLGNAQNNVKYDIYVRDFRFDTGYAGYYFPNFDHSIEDKNKGLTGTCTFMFTQYMLLPRTDSIHVATGDTTHFEVYIVDRAGHESNHIITSQVIMKI